jgi:hypothetical protein
MSDLNKDELLAKAHELGVRVQSNWKPETIEAAIARHLADQAKQGAEATNLDPVATPLAEQPEATEAEGSGDAEGEPETLLGVVAAEEPESSTEGNGEARERAAKAGLQLPEDWTDEQVEAALAEFELSLDDAPPALAESEYPTGHSPRG